MSHRSQRFQLPENTRKSSKTTINIAGFHVYLYGVDELTPQQAKDTVILFHIHGRTRNYKDAEEFAYEFLFQVRKRGDLERGVVVATLDNRNHGLRAVWIPIGACLGETYLLTYSCRSIQLQCKTSAQFTRTYIITVTMQSRLGRRKPEAWVCSPIFPVLKSFECSHN